MVEDEEMRNMTSSQIIEACQGHKYLLFRLASDFSLVGVNCDVVRLVATRKHPADVQTRYISYRSCDLMEYITYKIPYV